MWAYSDEPSECQKLATDIIHASVFSDNDIMYLRSSVAIAPGFHAHMASVYACARTCSVCTVHHMLASQGRSLWCVTLLVLRGASYLMGHRNAPAFGVFEGLAFHIVCRLRYVTCDLFSLCVLQLRQREGGLLSSPGLVQVHIRLCGFTQPVYHLLKNDSVWNGSMWFLSPSHFLLFADISLQVCLDLPAPKPAIHANLQNSHLQPFRLPKIVIKQNIS